VPGFGFGGHARASERRSNLKKHVETPEMFTKKSIYKKNKEVD
jgi:hypothetical protein